MTVGPRGVRLTWYVGPFSAASRLPRSRADPLRRGAVMDRPVVLTQGRPVVACVGLPGPLGGSDGAATVGLEKPC